MNERLIHLRIKIKSLAAEAAIIRAEARKTTGMVKWGLNHHRKTVVREYARENLLAYGAIKGIPYEAIEKQARIEPDFSRISHIAERFGGSTQAIEQWVQEARAYIKMCKAL